MPAYVVLDAGTGGGKCIIFDDEGRRLGASQEPWGYQVERDAEIPFVKKFSFDPQAFWDVLCRCTRRALEESGRMPGDVVAIAATSQREGCVFLDAALREVYAGPNLDARAFREALEVLAKIGNERLYRITGHSAPFIFPLSRYLWHRAHGGVPVAHVLMINDWMTWRLSGAFCTEPSNAVESMLFDLEVRHWSQEILAAFDIPAVVLPEVRMGGECAGTLTATAAAATGLLAGTPVLLGGADTQCSLLGAGVVEAGQVGATLGTTTPVQMVVAQPTFDPAANLWAGCHVVPDRWVLESNAGDTGDAYLWLLDLVSGGAPRERLYALGEELAMGGFAPQSMLFAGPTVFDLNKMRLNRPGGWLFPFPSLHVRPDRRTLVRSFLESIGYAIRANLEQLAAVGGVSPGELTVSGGMSRSAALRQTLADVSGLPLRVAREPESAALGCAVLMVAQQSGGDFAGTAQRIVRHDEVRPDCDRHAAYEAPYRKWRQLHDQLDEMEI